jgi:hypothetical protein
MKKINILFLITLIFGVWYVNVQAQSPFSQTPTSVENNLNAGLNENVGSYEQVSNNNGLPVSNTAGGSSSNPTNMGAGNSSSIGAPTGVGIGLPSGNPVGAGSGIEVDRSSVGNFLDYLIAIIFGSNNENPITPTPDGNITPNPNIFNPNQNDYVVTNNWKISCSLKTKSLGGYISFFTCIGVTFIPIVVGLLILWLMFGAIKYVSDNESEAREQYKTFLIWGVLIVFVALSFVAILRVLTKTTGL